MFLHGQITRNSVTHPWENMTSTFPVSEDILRSVLIDMNHIAFMFNSGKSPDLTPKSTLSLKTYKQG